MKARSISIQSRLERAERAILDDLKVQDHIAAAAATPCGLRRFAEAFYFCRVGFVRANFMLGARCPYDERYWLGIARNLWEEAGGGIGPAHNALYRRFLKAAGHESDCDLTSPPFANQFNESWDRIVQQEPITDALVAFAAYEALDAPDYQMLYKALSGVISQSDLEFFRVHTEVRHVELFGDALDLIPDQAAFDALVERTASRVLKLQKSMWTGLIEYMAQTSVQSYHALNILPR